MMINTEHKFKQKRSSLFSGFLRSCIAQLVVLALFVSLLPVPAHAAFQDKSGSLPGTVSGTTVAVVVILAGAGIGFAIYAMKKRKGVVKLDTPHASFTDIAPGQPAKRSVAVTNIMNDPVTVKALTVEDKSGALAIGDARQVPFTLAPGEKFEIPVTLAPKTDSGKARLRMVVTSDKTKKEEVRFVEVSYGHKSSMLGKIIPKK